MSRDTVTVVAADDHAIVLQGLQALLSTDPRFELIGVAPNGQAAVDLCAQTAPDVALVDLLLPDMNGVEATKRIKSSSPRTQVVLLTSYEGDEFVMPAIEAGALSYVLKDTMADGIVDALAKAARGESVLSARVAKALMRAVSHRRDAAPHEALSDREMQVLHLIAEGLSNDDIANRLGISGKTVKSHVSNILGKLYLNDRTQAAVYAWKSGLMEKRS